ncbi:5-methyltetrahydropteroyltriglutamate--homocysteine methyltransferase [Roseovarius atlanticus]|uniref:5-methyltetrahydropteroyltriglutamate--homocysteine methyltransferase n=1 Tax=Roseovarius atlanticus TaxID=1641875 RepID=A0A0T5NSA7_9RHOB|nr:5-methyltetrahydropteroyltriglutamate--homocysteine methyltransferase [Roseovarius atlanticus]KRS11821.1 5-methyltetrahydropteroyltriglutamate--homocysteine methyltransferase [Roseovarius atlanticus]
MYDTLFPTSLVGSYPQPDWLIDREKLRSKGPPRVRDASLWKMAEADLAEAQDAATRLAILDQEEIGLDIVTDGEVRRESYSNHLATSLDGLDLENPGTKTGRSGRPMVVPRVVGPIQRREPVMEREAAFLRKHTKRLTKMTLPGPFTMTMQALNEHYENEAALAMAYAEMLREEIADIFAAGVDIVQLDEPYMQAEPEAARAFAIPAINHALQGAAGRTVIHMCFGYAYIMDQAKPQGYSFLSELEECTADELSIEVAQPGLDLSLIEGMKKGFLIGALDLGRETPETPEEVRDRLVAAAERIPAANIVAAPDCGMKYLPIDLTQAKLAALVEGSAMARALSR